MVIQKRHGVISMVLYLNGGLDVGHGEGFVGPRMQSFFLSFHIGVLIINSVGTSCMGNYCVPNTYYYDPNTCLNSG